MPETVPLFALANLDLSVKPAHNPKAMSEANRTSTTPSPAGSNLNWLLDNGPNTKRRLLAYKFKGIHVTRTSNVRATQTSIRSVGRNYGERVEVAARMPTGAPSWAASVGKIVMHEKTDPDLAVEDARVDRRVVQYKPAQALVTSRGYFIAASTTSIEENDEENLLRGVTHGFRCFEERSRRGRRYICVNCRDWMCPAKTGVREAGARTSLVAEQWDVEGVLVGRVEWRGRTQRVVALGSRSGRDGEQCAKGGGEELQTTLKSAWNFDIVWRRAKAIAIEDLGDAIGGQGGRGVRKVRGEGQRRVQGVPGQKGRTPLGATSKGETAAAVDDNTIGRLTLVAWRSARGRRQGRDRQFMGGLPS
ncbi:hypothetical protein B0H16DRAFT_1856884 [Mycena metata]|uniref:Uncharacterized protein n=1 Tax=Mycena metata TaxID=1033252 RepID=A0AAD7DG18_9AGAR|nr:hypothetical protein B0H16DRAFT_1856884 [Mycena metata]